MDDSDLPERPEAIENTVKHSRYWQINPKVRPWASQNGAYNIQFFYRLHHEGWTSKQICERIGINEATLRKLRSFYGIDKRNYKKAVDYRKKLMEEKIDKAIKEEVALTRPEEINKYIADVVKPAIQKELEEKSKNAISLSQLNGRQPAASKIKGGNTAVARQSWDAAFHAAITPEDVFCVVRKLADAASKGEAWAIPIFLDRTLGKVGSMLGQAAQSEIVSRIDVGALSNEQLLQLSAIARKIDSIDSGASEGPQGDIQGGVQEESDRILEVRDNRLPPEAEEVR